MGAVPLVGGQPAGGQKDAHERQPLAWKGEASEVGELVGIFLALSSPKVSTESPQTAHSCPSDP